VEEEEDSEHQDGKIEKGNNGITPINCEEE
jgi:hypothetical protein